MTVAFFIPIQTTDSFKASNPVPAKYLIILRDMSLWQSTTAKTEEQTSEKPTTDRDVAAFEHAATVVRVDALVALLHVANRTVASFHAPDYFIRKSEIRLPHVETSSLRLRGVSGVRTTQHVGHVIRAFWFCNRRTHNCFKFLLLEG